MHIWYNNKGDYMADVCLDCLNKIMSKKYSKRKFILSRELEFCENCGEYKNIVIVSRKQYYLYKFRYVLLPFKVIYRIIEFLVKILFIPYLVYRYKKCLKEQNEYD